MGNNHSNHHHHSGQHQEEFTQYTSSISKPSYLPPPGSPPAGPVPPPYSQTSQQRAGEDPLLMLRRYTTVIVVDDSSSMYGERWAEAGEALAALASIAERYETDGLDICFLNNWHYGRNIKSEREVEAIFDRVQPSGCTPTGERLERLLRDYIKEYRDSKGEVKPINFLVITDGEATDDPEYAIRDAARKLDELEAPLSQVGIQFVQIGTDPEATKFLEYLDDRLSTKYGVRDMVDTTPSTHGNRLNHEAIVKILIGAINRRIDREVGDGTVS